MKRRVMIASAAAAIGLLLPLAAAATPASAGTGVGCTGSDCSVSIWQWVRLSGSVGPGVVRSNPINVPPPPCLWNPIGNAITGSQYIINLFPDPPPNLSFNIPASVKQAKQLLKDPQPGTWYNLPINPAAGAAGEAECLKLPAFVFVPPGGTPPMPHVPAIDLAEYAYNHMVVPKPVLTVSPATKSFVNLATYVWTNTPGAVTATATLGGESVTVTAEPETTTVSSDPASAGTAYNNCGRLGSAVRPIGKAPDSGPGVHPDCGVLWQAPANGATVSARVQWRVTWTGGQLPGIGETGTSVAFPVQEIQSVNGNG
jgi:hypothetical protein